MSDFISFDEGANLLLDSGIGTSTVYFLLSTKPVEGTGSHKASDKLSTGVGEITGTGYARQSQKAPSAASRAKTFAEMSWATEAHTDWPASVKSVVLCTTSNATTELTADGDWKLFVESSAPHKAVEVASIYVMPLE